MKIKKNNVDFSVIIPVFNTLEEHLRTCIASVMKNDTCTYEIILVDDGSEKETESILLKLEEENPCIKVHICDHKGVSATRNYGTSCSKGDYITYLDSDDCLVPGILDEIKEIFEKEKPDLLITQISREIQTMQGTQTCVKGSEELKDELRKYYLTLDHPKWRGKSAWINRAPHGRFLTRELAKKVLYREDIAFGEDVLWNFDLLRNTDNVLLYLKQGYCYCRVGTSVTQKYRPQFPEEVRKLLGYYKKEMQDWPEEIRAYYETAAIEYFTILMRIYVMSGNSGDSWKKYNEEIQSDFWQQIFKKVKLSDLRGRYLLTGFLGKYHLYSLLFWIFRKYYESK